MAHAHNIQKKVKDASEETKLCIVCQKSFSNRKKWRDRNQFAAVKYCSERCRRAARRLGISEGV